MAPNDGYRRARAHTQQICIISPEQVIMIVERRLLYVQASHVEEAVALIVAEIEHFNPLRPIWLYRALTNRFGTLAIEIEFESLAEYEQREFRQEWRARPKASTFIAQWRAMEEPSAFTSKLIGVKRL